jgi:hypothetical protein
MNPFFHFDLWDLPIVEANVYIVYVMGLLNLLMIGTKKHTKTLYQFLLQLSSLQCIMEFVS